MLTSPPLPTDSFAYENLRPEVRDWLRDAADRLRLLAQRMAADLVRCGLELTAARARLKARTFRRWVAAELPWSRAKAYRLIAVAETFAPLLPPALPAAAPLRIEPTAFYLLARPEVPDEARALAVTLAGEKVVTAADARRLLAACRPGPNLSDKEVRSYEGRRKKADVSGTGETGGPAVATKPAELDVFEQLVGTASVVHISRLAEEGGEDECLYSVTVYSENDRPRNAVRRRLWDAIGAVAGREPEKLCPECQQTKPASLFGENDSQPDGRNRECKACARERLGGLKRKKRDGKKVA